VNLQYHQKSSPSFLDSTSSSRRVRRLPAWTPRSLVGASDQERGDVLAFADFVQVSRRGAGGGLEELLRTLGADLLLHALWVPVCDDVRAEEKYGLLCASLCIGRSLVPHMPRRRLDVVSLFLWVASAILEPSSTSSRGARRPSASPATPSA